MSGLASAIANAKECGRDSGGRFGGDMHIVLDSALEQSGGPLLWHPSGFPDDELSRLRQVAAREHHLRQQPGKEQFCRLLFHGGVSQEFSPDYPRSLR